MVVSVTKSFEGSTGSEERGKILRIHEFCHQFLLFLVLDVLKSVALMVAIFHARFLLTDHLKAVGRAFHWSIETNNKSSISVSFHCVTKEASYLLLISFTNLSRFSNRTLEIQRTIANEQHDTLPLKKLVDETFAQF